MTTEKKAKLANFDAGENKLILLMANKKSARLAALKSIEDLDRKIEIYKAAIKSIKRERRKVEKNG